MAAKFKVGEKVNIVESGRIGRVVEVISNGRYYVTENGTQRLYFESQLDPLNVKATDSVRRQRLHRALDAVMDRVYDRRAKDSLRKLVKDEMSTPPFTINYALRGQWVGQEPFVGSKAEGSHMVRWLSTQPPSYIAKKAKMKGDGEFDTVYLESSSGQVVYSVKRGKGR
jgi:hypothetical protein